MPQGFKEGVNMGLNGTNRLLQQHHDRVHKSKMPLESEAFVRSPMRVAKGSSRDEVASGGDGFMAKTRMCVLHPNVNDKMSLHCTYNSYATTCSSLNLMPVEPALPIRGVDLLPSW